MNMIWTETGSGDTLSTAGLLLTFMKWFTAHTLYHIGVYVSASWHSAGLLCNRWATWLSKVRRKNICWKNKSHTHTHRTNFHNMLTFFDISRHLCWSGKHIIYAFEISSIHIYTSYLHIYSIFILYTCIHITFMIKSCLSIFQIIFILDSFMIESFFKLCSTYWCHDLTPIFIISSCFSSFRVQLCVYISM